MESFVLQQLVVSIVKFLRQQVETASIPGSTINEEGAESVEVAIQCLEAAYNLSPSSEISSNHTLYDIFSNALENQATSSSFMETENTCPQDKDQAEVFKNKGNALMYENKFLEAIDSYTSAIEKDSSNAAYYCNRAAAHSKLNNQQKAISDCRKALEIDPSRSKTYSRMGWSYTELDDIAQARQCYKKASELDPDNETYKMHLKAIDEKCTTQNQHPSNSSTPAANLLSGGIGGAAGFGPFAAMAGMDPGAGGAPSMANIFNNPNLMSMASQLMTDPNMQNMMSSLFGGQGGSRTPQNQPPPATESAPNPPPATTPTVPTTEASGSSGGGVNVDFLLNAGVQLAEQIQAQNPQLVEQLRSQLSRSNLRRGDNQDRNPPS